MADLIDRQAAIDAVEFGITYAKAFKSTGEVKELFTEGNKALNKAVERLKALPSAQPERKKGEWILTDFPDEQTYRCSSCNEHWTFLEGTPYDNGAYFCPNCGAEMEETNERS